MPQLGTAALSVGFGITLLEKPSRATDPEEASMANPVPAGSDVSAGTYRCTKCSNEIDVGSTQHLPPCPSCGNGMWETVSGGDSAKDPYPN
jgi:zinc ribbon family protein